MDTEERNRYFQELTLNLRRDGFAVGLEVDGLLPVELDSQRLCRITGGGGVRYRKEDVSSPCREAALEKVVAIAEATTEYMSQMELAPKLTASGLTGDYRLLAEFNGTVLAGHPTPFGAQFISWELTDDRSSLYHGNYYGPGVGAESYTSAKRDFTVRSGLVSHSALFTPEQMVEMYHCICETLASSYPITDERQKRLESAAEQIEAAVPDLDKRVSLSNQKEVELAAMESPQDGGMQFR